MLVCFATWRIPHEYQWHTKQWCTLTKSLWLSNTAWLLFIAPLRGCCHWKRHRHNVALLCIVDSGMNLDDISHWHPRWRCSAGYMKGGGLAALCFVCFYCPCSFFIHRLSTMTSMCNISAECKLCFGLYVACMESEMELALAWLIKSSWVVQCLADGPTSTGRQACSRAEPLNFRNDWTLVATERTGREAASGSGSGWHQATAAGYATLKQHKVDELRSQVRPSY